MLRSAEGGLLDAPVKEGEVADNQIFDFLQFASGFNDIDEEMIEEFRKSKVQEKWRKLFDGSSKEKKKMLVALGNLPAGEYKKLRDMSLKAECILPGIHDVGSALTIFEIWTNK